MLTASVREFRDQATKFFTARLLAIFFGAGSR
jgi:hypothetical protein